MTTLSLFSLLEEQRAAPASPELTPDQLEAVERRDGPLFVHAGAGSGKTRVLVERFVRSVLEDGVAVDRMLTITFTEKAATELRGRIRERFLSGGERDHARAVDSAWISTIHGFCSRLLRSHALEVGLDPEYRVLADHEAERLAAEAFEAALEDFLGPPVDSRRVELVAAYGADRLEHALRGVHAAQRTGGEREPGLPLRSAPQGVREAHDRLARAVRAAQQSLGGESAPGTQIRGALARLERCGGALDRLAPQASLDPLELRALGLRRGSARALRGDVFDELERAHATCLELCAHTRAREDLGLLDELLTGHGRGYAELKTQRSVLDFDDLELLARDLLRDRRAAGERTRQRFDHVLVDELQDTNALQSEILDLVAAGNLFTVGDDLQSIYGFRGAEVAVFSARREAARSAGRDVRLGASFRTCAEILDVLDAAFEPVFGAGFAPLAPALTHPPDAGAREPCVEVIAVERDTAKWDAALGDRVEPFGAAMHGAPPWRAAEARALALRVDELLGAGQFAPIDVAVLLRSWSDVARYEQALAERGVATYVAGGGGYWSDQQVADLRAYLATLANPRDEQALVALLASPLVGASLDALALLRLHAGRGRGLWRALEAAFADDGEEVRPRDGLAAALPEPDRERLTTFVRRLSAERSEVPRRSLADLIERAISATGYDRAVLAMPGGERRLANVRKLERLAREFEAAEGRDLRGFLDEIERRGAAAAREGDAPLEGEGVDAVRLMTIHAAKGLEFPLVCVGDLGRGEPRDSPVLRVGSGGRVGLRLPDPDGGSLDALEAAALAAEAAEAERAEERRLLWVAATRAERRLIVSGALDLERGSAGGAMAWLAPALVPSLRERYGAGKTEGTHSHAWAGREAGVAWRVVSPADLDRALAPADRAPLAAVAAGGTSEPTGEPAAGLGHSRGAESGAAPSLGDADHIAQRRPPGAAPPGGEVSRVSYSALESYRRCGYRFYLEHRLGLDADARTVPRSSRAATDPATGLDALTRGAVVHELLESVDLRCEDAPDGRGIAARLRARGAPAGAGEVEELERLLAAFARSPLRERMISAESVRRELAFAFPLEILRDAAPARSVLVEGVIDAYCRSGPDALVVDYKTDRLDPGADLEAVCDEAYASQRLVYALAGLRGGARAVEVAHLFLERPREPVIARYEASRRRELESRLAALAGELVAGRYEPCASPGAHLCRGCPGRDALCWWPPERTGAPAETG